MSTWNKYKNELRNFGQNYRKKINFFDEFLMGILIGKALILRFSHRLIIN